MELKKFLKFRGFYLCWRRLYFKIRMIYSLCDIEGNLEYLNFVVVFNKFSELFYIY